MPRVLLLLATTTYRAEDFLEAAAELGVEVVVGSDERQALTDLVPGSTLEVDFQDLGASTRKIAEAAEDRPFDAIVAAEDEGAVLAAVASAALGLPHNSLASVHAARYKHRMRRSLAEAGVRSPAARTFRAEDDPAAAARQVRFPCVLKPVSLSASRGVIRADDERGFVEAFRRVASILGQPDVVARGAEAASLILVEDYVPGEEVALEGLLTHGELRVLALFDKPDPLEGPYFEETLYVRPSRKPRATRAAIEETVAATARALGLHHGPVHAELRLNDQGVWVIEIAARSIGGLCSRTLRFGAGISLEQLILRHAVGMEDVVPAELAPDPLASGVLMIPIPRAGVLREARGVAEAETVTGIEGVTISIPIGQEVVPLPEGRRYLGFVFGRAETPEDVEAALREAHRRLDLVIEPVER